MDNISLLDLINAGTNVTAVLILGYIMLRGMDIVRECCSRDDDKH